MPKLKLEDLARIKERVKPLIALREGEYKTKITVQMGTCGIASGARKIMQVLLEEIAQREIKGVILTVSGCAGLCSREPMATVELKGKAPVKYVDLNEEKIRKILLEHVVGGKIVEEYVLKG